MLVLCNAYTTRIHTAIMFYSPDTCGSDGDFETMGWWNLDPGSCATVYGNDLEDLNRYWYCYAEADDGAVWAGPYIADIPLGAFDSCIGLGTSPGRRIGYRELDIGDNDDYTVTFHL